MTTNTAASRREAGAGTSPAAAASEAQGAKRGRDRCDGKGLKVAGVRVGKDGPLVAWAQRDGRWEQVWHPSQLAKGDPDMVQVRWRSEGSPEDGQASQLFSAYESRETARGRLGRERARQHLENPNAHPMAFAALALGPHGEEIAIRDWHSYDVFRCAGRYLYEQAGLPASGAGPVAAMLPAQMAEDLRADQEAFAFAQEVLVHCAFMTRTAVFSGRYNGIRRSNIPEEDRYEVVDLRRLDWYTYGRWMATGAMLEDVARTGGSLATRGTGAALESSVLDLGERLPDLVDAAGMEYVWDHQEEQGLWRMRTDVHSPAMAELRRPLHRAAEQLGVRVVSPTQQLDSGLDKIPGAEGFAVRGIAGISLGARGASAPALEAHTLCHEIGHLLDPAQYLGSHHFDNYSLGEVVAETTAATVGQVLAGAPVSGTSRWYVAGYINGYLRATGGEGASASGYTTDALPAAVQVELEARVRSNVGLLVGVLRGDAGALRFARALVQRNALVENWMPDAIAR